MIHSNNISHLIIAISLNTNILIRGLNHKSSLAFLHCNLESLVIHKNIVRKGHQSLPGNDSQGLRLIQDSHDAIFSVRERNKLFVHQTKLSIRHNHPFLLIRCFLKLRLHDFTTVSHLIRDLNGLTICKRVNVVGFSCPLSNCDRHNIKEAAWPISLLEIKRSKVCCAVSFDVKSERLSICVNAVFSVALELKAEGLAFCPGKSIEAEEGSGNNAEGQVAIQHAHHFVCGVVSGSEAEVGCLHFIGSFNQRVKI